MTTGRDAFLWESILLRVFFPFFSLRLDLCPEPPPGAPVLSRIETGWR
jgi:hypothetical protein